MAARIYAVEIYVIAIAGTSEAIVGMPYSLDTQSLGN